MVSALLSAALVLGAAGPAACIVGGYEVQIQDHPWMASVLMWDTHWCGASIVSHKHVLTGANCLKDGTVPYTIRVGTNYITGGEIFNIEKIRIHERFNETFMDYDVAVATVKDDFEMTQKVQVMMLPNTWRNPGEKVVVAGWGYKKETGKLADRMYAVELVLISREECQSSYPHTLLTSRMVCAGEQQGGKDACYGDAGGPLVAEHREQVGIVSFGEGCGRAGQPGIYSDVVTLRPWIEHQMSKDGIF